ncbi:MAG: Rieske (2Fe-2S) protein [Porphyrobacter sp.]|nr:Rieske (2Fe-2S) protein [Porphyrobacter sp.]
MNPTWHEVCRQDDFPADGKFAAAIAGWRVLIVEKEGVHFAYNDRCPHQGALLSPGRIRSGGVMCPLHGARFKINTGECIGGAYAALRSFDVRVEGGMIAVALPDEAPGPGDIPVMSSE